MRVVWTSLAEEQAADAFAYIAADRPAAASSWLEQLLDRVKSLGKLPDQGRVVPEARRESIRELLVEPYRVVYRRDPDTVFILTIQHQRRDLGVEEVT